MYMFFIVYYFIIQNNLVSGLNSLSGTSNRITFWNLDQLLKHYVLFGILDKGQDHKNSNLIIIIYHQNLLEFNSFKVFHFTLYCKGWTLLSYPQ
jgi:hypothetical protein